MQRRDYHFWVYVLASRSRNLYTGMTNDLLGRVSQHRELVPGSFTARYCIDRLVHFEHFQYVRSAIAREKEVKRWTRAQRIALIEQGKSNMGRPVPWTAVAKGRFAAADLRREQTADPLRG